jgi:hypothetical protein
MKSLSQKESYNHYLLLYARKYLYQDLKQVIFGQAMALGLKLKLL